MLKHSITFLTFFFRWFASFSYKIKYSKNSTQKKKKKKKPNEPNKPDKPFRSIIIFYLNIVHIHWMLSFTRKWLHIEWVLHALKKWRKKYVRFLSFFLSLIKTKKKQNVEILQWKSIFFYFFFLWRCVWMSSKLKLYICFRISS